LGQHLQDRGVTQYEFIPFEMRATLQPDPANPLRNWHVIVDGERWMTNGIGVLFKESLLVIHPSSAR
jgi:hypothetical protein